MKNVIVMGKGELAIRIAGWFLEYPDYRLTAIVPVIPEPTWTPSFMTWGRGKAGRVNVIESGRYTDLPHVRDEGWTADLVFSLSYDRIVKDWFIRKCGKILNVHNGPLPRYRGVSAINWALKNEETEHGVTLHEIAPGIDDGPIVAQFKYSIYPEFDEVIDVCRRAIEFGWMLFQHTMPILDKITPRPQDHALASYYSKSQDALLAERRDFTKAKSLARMSQAYGATPENPGQPGGALRRG